MSTLPPPQPSDQVLDRLTALGSDLSTAVIQYHQAAAERFGLNATDMKTIPLLHSSMPQSAGDLARSLGLTTGAVTSVIDRLEKIGLVRRVPDPNDRRRVLVELVSEKFSEISMAYQPLAQAVRALHRTFSDDQLEIIARYTEASIELMKAEAARFRRTQD